MSVFGDGGDGLIAKQVGKPDYEKLIEALKKLNTATTELYQDLINYIDIHKLYLDPNRRIQFTFPELLGSLDLEMRNQNKQIAVYMAEMEKA